MLRNFKTLFCLLPALLFIACDRCMSIRSCADPFAFKIVDKSSGQDLVFGTSPVYNQDSVHLFTNLSRYGNGNFLRVQNNTLMSGLVDPIDTLFLKLTSTDTDTLFLSYTYIERECCFSPKGFGQLRSIKYNKNIAIKEDDIYVFKK